MNHPAGLPDLLSAAATVLEAITEDLPPLTVDCDPHPPVGSPVTIAPSASADEAQVQQHAVEHLARILGTWARPIEHGPGWIADGAAAGVAVTAMAAPIARTIYRPKRRPGEGAAAHAKLLRDLVAWTADLPEGVRALQATESQNGDGLRVNLEVDPAALASVLEAHAILTPGPAGSWDRSRGVGLTPTGHELTISTR